MTILDKINNIREQKDAYVTPGNIKKDVTILNVTGALEEGDINALFENQNLSWDQLNLRYDLITAMSNLSTNGVTYQYWSTGRLTNSYMVPKLSNSSSFYARYSNLKYITSVPPFIVPYSTSYNNCQRMFENCRNLLAIPASCNFYNAADVSYMFMNCVNLISAPLITVNKPASPTTQSLACSGMFWNCSNLQLIEGLNIQYIAMCEAMFSDCFKIREINNIQFRFYKEMITTSTYPSMAGFFRNCYNLRNLCNFETGYFNSAAEAFCNCYNISELPNFSFNNIKIANSMFYRCFNLINANQFDFPNLIQAPYMFAYCYNLQDVSEFHSSDINNMTGMFLRCNNLSDNAIQNIINMVLNSNVPEEYRYIYSAGGPFIYTNISNTRFQNRWAELDAAGWTY